MGLLRFVFNVVWVLLIGIWSFVANIVMIVLSVCLIVPIFLGVPLVYFRVTPLSLAPAGKKVKLNFKAAPVRNILYLIFGGFIRAALSYAWAIAIFCTIIGIPVALQEFKFAKFYIAPFGAKIVDINSKDIIEGND